MCGICFTLSEEDEVKNFDSCLLASRGPDIKSSRTFKIGKLICHFEGCVLWMQGDSPQKQPIVNVQGDAFLWNGDNFNFERNLLLSDTVSIFKEIENKSEEDLVSYLASIEGPWSFIYFSQIRQRIYFGRDLYGRHSLLWTFPHDSSNFILCSVARRNEGLREVPALGIYAADVLHLLSNDKKMLLYPYFHVTTDQLCSHELEGVTLLDHKLAHNVTVPLNQKIPSNEMVEELKSCGSSLQGASLLDLEQYLKYEITTFTSAFQNAIKKRVDACPHRCKNCTASKEPCKHSKYAVLFSGGLDSALIALFLSKCLPAAEPIDLLNVSFENLSSLKNVRKGRPSDTIYKSPFNSPDRESGLTCLNQLQLIDPNRIWNFVEINVTAEELQNERKEVIHHLIAPHLSVLDDSIGCALYFCGKGKGILNGCHPYESPARVLFSGLGADEQLAGYSRHRGLFESQGWDALLDEIHMEMNRIHARNCGRDDRVLSHHGRTARFPYLDEDVVNCLNAFPIWRKANLYLPRGVGEKLLLRVIAALHSLSSAAALPKRAIQFGSRIAKLENTKEKGKDVCTRLQKVV